MSRVELEQAACVGKHPFPTKRTALDVAKRMKQRGKGKSDVYRCPHCGKFHVGHHDDHQIQARRKAYREFADRGYE